MSVQCVCKGQCFITDFAFRTVLRVTTWSSTLPQQCRTIIVQDAVPVVRVAMDQLNIIVCLAIWATSYGMVCVFKPALKEPMLQI